MYGVTAVAAATDRLSLSLFSLIRLLLPFSSGGSGEVSAQAKGTAAADEMRRVITLIVFFGFPEANDPLSLPFSLSSECNASCT